LIDAKCYKCGEKTDWLILAQRESKGLLIGLACGMMLGIMIGSSVMGMYLTN
jgi:hypothetical protein